MTRRFYGLVLALAAMSTTGWTAEGSSSQSLIDGRGFLLVGTFVNSTALDIRLDSSTGLPGTEIDWGQRFGLEDSRRFRLDGVWRFTPKHHLRLLYTDYSQTDRTTLDSIVQWG